MGIRITAETNVEPCSKVIRHIVGSFKLNMESIMNIIDVATMVSIDTHVTAYPSLEKIQIVFNTFTPA